MPTRNQPKAALWSDSDWRAPCSLRSQPLRIIAALMCRGAWQRPVKKTVERYGYDQNLNWQTGKVVQHARNVPMEPSI